MLARPARLVVALAPLLAVACASAPPPAPKTEDDASERQPRQKVEAPTMEYDLGAIAPEVQKRRLAELKPKWTACYQDAHEHNETLSGTITFTLRTNKDGTVKWAYVTDSSIGDRGVEKCVIDSIKAADWGTPVDAREGEIKSHTFGWESDDDARALPGEESQVMPAIKKVKAKIDACRKDAGATGSMTATLTVAPKGKPLAVGIAISDPSADGAIDCVADVLRGLTYTNKSSQPIKVTVAIP
jgi:hypothetical protein